MSAGTVVCYDQSMAASPFPGMDPFLEDPGFCEGFHYVLIIECMFDVEQSLPDDYISNIKESIDEISPDDPAAKYYSPHMSISRAPIEVREAYIEVLRVPGYELVTVIELMSPWNKNGAGIGIHQGKRAALVLDGVHFVELDLLRGGTRTHLARPLPPGDYYVNIFRGDRKPEVDVYRWRLRDKLPKIPIPLRAPDQGRAAESRGSVAHGIRARAV
jgi:hypothetical protein